MISKEQIKKIRSLQQKKFRDIHQMFIIEGPKMIQEAINKAPESILEIFGVSERENFILPQFQYQQITEKNLQQVSGLKNPQSQLAICQYLPKEEIKTDFILAIDTVQDPGNLGTILRLASWFGVKKIVASKETVDCYNPKVVQASMGAIFTVQIEYVDLKTYLSNASLPIYGALLDGENIYTKSIERKGILLLGNEGNGIHEDLIPLVNHRITIPQFGEGESLNVAMATAILLSEFSRPR